MTPPQTSIIMEITGIIFALIFGFFAGLWISFKIAHKLFHQPKINTLKEFDSELLINVFDRYRSGLIRNESYEEISTVEQIIESLKIGKHLQSIDSYQVNGVVLNIDQYGYTNMAFYVTKKEAKWEK